MLCVVGKSRERPREISRVRFAHERTRISRHPVIACPEEPALICSYSGIKFRTPIRDLVPWNRQSPSAASTTSWRQYDCVVPVPLRGQKIVGEWRERASSRCSLRSREGGEFFRHPVIACPEEPALICSYSGIKFRTPIRDLVLARP